MAKKAAKKAARTRAAPKRAAAAPADHAATRAAVFGSIRKGEWAEWSGRQIRTINDQAARYGAPIGGPSIDLPAFVRWFHDFLAERSRALAVPEGEDPELSGYDSPALEQQRRLKNQLLEIQLARELGNYVPRLHVHTGLATFAGLIRKAGEVLQRQYGDDAYQILDEALVEAQNALERALAHDESETDTPAQDG